MSSGLNFGSVVVRTTCNLRHSLVGQHAVEPRCTEYLLECITICSRHNKILLIIKAVLKPKSHIYPDMTKKCQQVRRECLVLFRM